MQHDHFVNEAVRGAIMRVKGAKINGIPINILNKDEIIAVLYCELTLTMYPLEKDKNENAAS